MSSVRQNQREYSDQTVEIIIPNDVGKERLDRFIGRKSDLKITRSLVQKLIGQGLVAVDGFPAGHNHIVYGGEKVTISIPPPTPMKTIPENIPLEVVYEDDYLLVVNKPAGMVTHPAAGNYTGTMVNALLHYTSNLSSTYGKDRPGIVHRLDKNTSGLILIARNDEVHLSLQKQLQAREIKRTYFALVCGHMKNEKGEIDLPIGRSLKDRKKMAVTYRKSRTARTDYELLNRFRLYDYLKINLHTGRTHQIRVHFRHLGHPVLGDPDYGGRLKWHKGIFSIDKKLAQKVLSIINRQALHAGRLELTHPVSQKNLVVESELPEDFKDLLKLLGKEG
jgi:23S rRNA pseudouridine1911/1915/1917 synthase